MKRLAKSNDRKLFGVCGGIAEYFNIDPVIVRIGWVILTCFLFGTGVVVYLVASFIMPDKDYHFEDYDVSRMKSANVDDYAETVKEKKESASRAKGHSSEEFDSYFEK